MAKPEGHGRDHRWGGMDETPPSRWMYVLPIAPAASPSTYDGEYDASDMFYPSFAGAWGNVSSSFLPFAFRYNQGGIEFRGAITGDEATPNSLIATIPTGYPFPSKSQRHYVQVGSDGSGIGTIESRNDGTIVWIGEVTGAAGANGADGTDGVGVPVGGTTGQVLEKASGTDYDTDWSTPHYIPTGGSTGQALRKNSGTNYDASWLAVHEPPVAGSTGYVLTKNSGTDYDYSWAAATGSGSGWHDGSGAPAGGLGAVGDYYLDDDTGDIYVKTGVSTWTKETAGARIGDLVLTINGNGSVITTGVKGDIAFDFAGQILQWTLLADLSGSIQLDLWKVAYASYPATVANTITASAKPLISSAVKAQSGTLTGWTTTFSAGDTLRVNVDSITTITRAVLVLKVKRT